MPPERRLQGRRHHRLLVVGLGLLGVAGYYAVLTGMGVEQKDASRGDRPGRRWPSARR
jgi:hypothetical protein